MSRRIIIPVVGLFLLCATASARSESIASGECSVSSAAVQQLAKIENTRDSNYNCLGVRVDDHANIVGVLFEKHEFAGKGPEHREPPATREFTPAEIGAEGGVVLDGAPGHDAIRLRGSITAGASVAPLVVSYLYNGVVGEFRECAAVLERGAADRWRLINAAHAPVSHILVRTWGLPILGTVGIETLQGICAPVTSASHQ